MEPVDQLSSAHLLDTVATCNTASEVRSAIHPALDLESNAKESLMLSSNDMDDRCFYSEESDLEDCDDEEDFEERDVNGASLANEPIGSRDNGSMAVGSEKSQKRARRLPVEDFKYQVVSTCF